MKKVFYFIMVLAAVMALAGCNSSESDNSNDNNTNTASPSVTEPTSDVETQKEEPIIDEQSSEGTVDKEGTLNEGNMLIYSSKGQEMTATTEIVKSDNQSFTIALLPEFILSAEEPGKDVVLYKANDQVFMRIETVSLADTTYENMLQATEEFMKASSNNGETLADGEAVKLAPANAKNVVAFRNDYETDSTVALLFETDSLFVRLTVFDTKEVDLTDAMLKMGATIK